jgi:midasin (ATPase involved in ribosome maturation)
MLQHLSKTLVFRYSVNMKPQILVIVGQTATGKSELAVHLAHTLSGEVISADSRQVYRGMDLGTGKITKDEMQGIPHHLLDIKDPNEDFSVEEFQQKKPFKLSRIFCRVGKKSNLLWWKLATMCRQWSITLAFKTVPKKNEKAPK